VAVSEEKHVISREDVIRSLGPEEQRWIARCQILAVLLFVGLFAGVLLLESGAPETHAMVSTPAPPQLSAPTNDNASAAAPVP
jgi:hypothetical protein